MAQSDTPQQPDVPEQPDTSQTAQDDDYSGPAILSRGQTPANQKASPIGFRPYIGLNAIYDTGLAPVAATPNGGISNTDLFGVELNLGAYMHHVWKHTTLGLDYRGDFRHYSKTYWDGTDQFLALILTHHPSRRVTYTLRNQAGIYSLNSFSLSSPLGTADPNYLLLPQYNLFDSRIIFAGVSADVIYELTRRLSFDAGGQGSLVRWQSTALYGFTGAVAKGDLEYRATRHTTVGADYRFMYFGYTKGYGSTYVESVGLDYSTRLTRHLQFSGRAGAARVDVQSLTEVTLDPSIAALLGQSVAIQASNQTNYVPDIEARLTNNFRQSLVTLEYRNEVIPGNGVYFTSRNTAGIVSYSYSGVRKWNFAVNANYGKIDAITQTIGKYTTYGGGVGVTRNLGKGLYSVTRFDAMRYDVAHTLGFNNTEYRATLGLIFSPGDVPLVLW